MAATRSVPANWQRAAGLVTDSLGSILQGEPRRFDLQHAGDVKTVRTKADRAQCFRCGNGGSVANNIKTFQWKLCLTLEVFDQHYASFDARDGDGDAEGPELSVGSGIDSNSSQLTGRAQRNKQ